MKKYFTFDTGIYLSRGNINVQLKVSKIQKDTENNPMFVTDYNSGKPWEVRIDNGYPNVIYDKKYKKYRCFYTLCITDDLTEKNFALNRTLTEYVGYGKRMCAVACAESDDGINWYKPNYGVVDFHGKDTNLIRLFAHGAGIMLDEEETDSSKRYKMVCKVEYSHELNYMAVCFSEDGIHWGDFIKWPRNCPHADSHNFPFRDKKDGKFKLITRTWQNGLRLSTICESTDFINWSEPREILRGDGMYSQVYSMPIYQYEGYYIGLASMYHDGDSTLADYDMVDLELAYSTNTQSVFDRAAPNDYLIEKGKGSYPNGEWDNSCIYAAAPIEDGDKLWIYYMGGNGLHTSFRETSFGRGYIYKDKLAYLAQRDAKQEGLTTMGPFMFSGNRLYIHADVEKGGTLKACLRKSFAEVLPGFDYQDCKLTDTGNGWYQLTVENQELLYLYPTSVLVQVTFSNAKIYGVYGDIDIAKGTYNGYLGGGF